MSATILSDFEIFLQRIFQDLKFSEIFYVQSVHEIPNLQIKKIMQVWIIYVYFFT